MQVGKIICGLLLCVVAEAFLLGLERKVYREGETVELLVNKVESDHTQLPFGYYELPFVCPPSKDARPLHLSLGEILKGDRVWQSDYQMKFMLDLPCMRLCDVHALESAAKKADYLVKNGYVAQWTVDGLPGATTFVSGTHKNKYYASGFPLGFTKNDISYIYNHFTLVIRYHKDPSVKDGYNIVGFEVYPKSVKDPICPGNSKDYENLPLVPKADASGKKKVIIPWTYSVYWREDHSVTYKDRWDSFYQNDASNQSHKIQWLSIINSMVLLSLLSLAVAVVLSKMLKQDIQRKNALPTTSIKSSTSSGSLVWQRLEDEVFSSPRFTLVFCVILACGIQILFAAAGVVVIFAVGSNFDIGRVPSNSLWLFRSHDGAFFSLSIFLLLASGFVSSYLGIIAHKIFQNDPIQETYRLRKTLFLSLLFSGSLPGTILLVVYFLNFFVWYKESSNALPFGTIVVLLIMFSLIELPLGIVGGYLGNIRKVVVGKDWLRTVQTGHRIKSNAEYLELDKRTPWFSHPILSTIVFGVIPFGVVYVDLNVIFNSIWLEKTTFYYKYGFLLLTLGMLFMVLAESAVIAIYVLLAVYSNPHWQWLSFNVGSSIGWFVYAYLTYYFIFHMHVSDFVLVLLYFVYMGLVSALFGVACGVVAVMSGYIFVSKIYQSNKVD
ncbi:uncharacterized protein KQ657_003783 [Scheffersomyces spartinae]|uniref:Transmembrane 9 superfamily member n=1 Tax=Scheffersomyces spartinae TaxID=45513 RepID=A0A9P8AKL7_9ASCO|nr:uncharacterized protein KQ657_003783 [Scheffersomyces spartinae]KAG7195257.1 hypothetical protein KQ657_003783 [Scheffersomyces spartinae]